MSGEENHFRLPVSGRVVCVRPLCGTEDLLLAESSIGDLGLAIRLADNLTRDIEGVVLDWGGLAVTDLDAFVVFLRQMLIGDRIQADVKCGAPECGQRFDLNFGLHQFLAHHAPSPPTRVCRGWLLQPGQEPGWYQLAPASAEAESLSERVSFRLPTPNDQLAVRGEPNAEDELARRCLQPAWVPARLRHRAEAVMEAMAPCLACELQAVCPECGLATPIYFEPRHFCLRELRDRAASVYADVDLLARRYHWSEDQILALPRTRRAAYVGLARSAESN